MNETSHSDSPDKAPSDPDQDPKVHPAPPGNPEIDEERLKQSEEGLEEVVGR